MLNAAKMQFFIIAAITKKRSYGLSLLESIISIIRQLDPKFYITTICNYPLQILIHIYFQYFQKRFDIFR